MLLRLCLPCFGMVVRAIFVWKAGKDSWCSLLVLLPIRTMRLLGWPAILESPHSSVVKTVLVVDLFIDHRCSLLDFHEVRDGAGIGCVDIFDTLLFSHTLNEGGDYLFVDQAENCVLDLVETFNEVPQQLVFSLSKPL